MATKKKAAPASGPETASMPLLRVLEGRFAAHPQRHLGLAWREVERRIDERTLEVLGAMEASGGEPDVALIAGPGKLVFVDCATQSPSGRRSLCYDRSAWQARKEARPRDTVLDMVASIGAELLDEHDYRALQELGAFDTTTSSWLATPPDLRTLGGALFGDRRYERVFVYHNGAQSYYAVRGFRAKLVLQN